MDPAVYAAPGPLYGLALGGGASPRLAELGDAGVPRRAMLTITGVAVAALLIAAVGEDGALQVLLVDAKHRELRLRPCRSGWSPTSRTR